MTIAATTCTVLFLMNCISYLALRCLEEFARFCASFISRLTSKKKDKEVVASEYKRLVATVTPEFYETVKAHCLRTGQTTTQFTFNAITIQLRVEKSNEEFKKEGNG